MSKTLPLRSLTRRIACRFPHSRSESVRGVQCSAPPNHKPTAPRRLRSKTETPMPRRGQHQPSGPRLHHARHFRQQLLSQPEGIQGRAENGPGTVHRHQVPSAGGGARARRGLLLQQVQGRHAPDGQGRGYYSARRQGGPGPAQLPLCELDE